MVAHHRATRISHTRR